jgi:hypothetical protein
VNDRNEFSLPEELEELGGRLVEARPQLSALELDRVKGRAIAQAGRATRQGKGPFMRSRLATIMVAFALVLGGTGIVWAAAGGNPGSGGSSGSASNNQYCPPSSPGGGKPKHGHGHGHGHGGNKCGHEEGGGGDEGNGHKGGDESKGHKGGDEGNGHKGGDNGKKH